MYSYHNRIKQRIRAGELVGAEAVDHYPGIGACRVLYFATTPPARPIRPHAYDLYAEVWDKFL